MSLACGLWVKMKPFKLTADDDNEMLKFHLDYYASTAMGITQFDLE